MDGWNTDGRQVESIRGLTDGRPLRESISVHRSVAKLTDRQALSRTRAEQGAEVERQQGGLMRARPSMPEAPARQCREQSGMGASSLNFGCLREFPDPHKPHGVRTAVGA
jgi:hypothetical protein